MTATAFLDNGDNANDKLMAKDLAEALLAAYPGWLWAVNIEHKLLRVLNLNLSGRYGWTLKLPDVYSASSLKADTVRAGGEILERFNQPRGPFDASRYAALATGLNGCPIGDLTPTVTRLASAYGCR